MLQLTSRSDTAPATLREAHRALTRARICDAAKALFFAKGYAGATVDEIAAKAGMQRSTLYAHFKDKADILRVIAADHSVKLDAVALSLTQERPDRAEIDAWIDRLIAFVEVERSPVALFFTLGQIGETPDVLRPLSEGLFETLARTLPAFRAALGSGSKAMAAHVRAQQAVRELCWACLHRAQHGDTPYAREALRAAGDLFESFITAWT
jgi:AcrR family transcriptional regulator